jgi:hypothetical protein
MLYDSREGNGEAREKQRIISIRRIPNGSIAHKPGPRKSSILNGIYKIG